MSGILVNIETCLDCGHFQKTRVRHFLAGYEILYRYYCKNAQRDIFPDDGVKPPPQWCPLRETGGEK